MKKYTSVHVIRKKTKKREEMHFAQNIRINYVLKMNGSIHSTNNHRVPTVFFKGLHKSPS